MQITQSLRNELFALLAADTTTLAAAVANKMHLAMVDFVPGEGMIVADFTEADFDGATAIAVTVGAQGEGYDPATNDSVIDLKEPIGGFRWAVTGTHNLPQTIFGFYLTDTAGTVVYAAERFDTPVTLTMVGQVIDIGDARLTLPANSVS